MTYFLKKVPDSGNTFNESIKVGNNSISQLDIAASKNAVYVVWGGLELGTSSIYLAKST